MKRLWSWFSLEGRAGRAEYNAVLWSVLGALALMVWRFNVHKTSGTITLGPALGFAGGVAALALPLIAVVARRLHDIGRSVLWLVVVATVWRIVEPQHERLSPGAWREAAQVAPLALIFVALLVLAVKKGDPDKNEFGAPPGHGVLAKSE